MSTQNIKTWDDFLKEFHKGEDWNPKHELVDLSLYGIEDKVKAKIIATYKIAKLIELGYGGMITDEEWKNVEFKKYGIICRPYTKELFIKDIWNEQCFISFHTKQQAEEFMSYPENRKLVEQYHMT